MIALIFVFVGCFGLAACGETDQLTGISLSYASDDMAGCVIELDSAASSQDKYEEYNLTTTYGTVIN
ncbi:MAG: hypothetical protein NC087_05370, partial [Anaeroplasma bactoclasticum]|nr:hypothetical protein [Anaeroplasma bactoclasticum]